jgi:hypothetical protein
VGHPASSRRTWLVPFTRWMRCLQEKTLQRDGRSGWIVMILDAGGSQTRPYEGRSLQAVGFFLVFNLPFEFVEIQLGLTMKRLVLGCEPEFTVLLVKHGEMNGGG